MNRKQAAPRARESGAAPSGFEAKAARVSILCAALSVLVLGALHLLEPEVHPLGDFISEYALGRFGLLMNGVFLGLAASLVSFALATARSAKGATGKIGLVLIFVSAAGMVLAALFNTDPEGTPLDALSASGFLHVLGGQLNLTPFAALFLTLGLGKAEAWKPRRRALRLALVAVFISVVLFVWSAAAAEGAGEPRGAAGLFGRLMLLSYLAWQLIAAGAIGRSAG